MRRRRAVVFPAIVVAAAIAAGCASAASSTRSAGPTDAATTIVPPSSTTGAVPTSTTEAVTTTTVLPTTTADDGFAAQLPTGTQHLHYTFGPITIAAGQNNIAYSMTSVAKPAEDGYILRISSNLVRADGSVPPVDVVHLHHGVWLNLSAKDTSDPRLPERFFAVGEEKTSTELPSGYGYRYHASDQWFINYMLHDLTDEPDQVWITYDLDFVPLTSMSATNIAPVRPVWLDVQNGSIYPVFDVIQGSGTNGAFTYPDQAKAPYGSGPALNQWTVDTDGVLVATGGHLHPGGLHDDLSVQRGAKQAHLFRSDATYFEPAGAVSWDVAMGVTDPSWKVSVRKGDVLSVSTTYDSSRASWYESMGIMVVWMATGGSGTDPFATKVDTPGHITHGHLAENDHHGGQKVTLPDPSTFAPQPAASPIGILDFLYSQGDFNKPNGLPVVKRGNTITFTNNEPTVAPGIWHTITACKAPCNAETGIAFPIADGPVAFDSGQLGLGGPPTANRLSWTTPATLPPGTYTYFCRIHPFMRGAFQVTS